MEGNTRLNPTKLRSILAAAALILGLAAAQSVSAADPRLSAITPSGAKRGTEVEVTFAEIGEQTKVTLVHRGLERLAPAQAESHTKYGWRLLMPWFDDFIRAKRSTP